MVYTGKMSPGKHNFTRIIAAADSLQMFDVAVGSKNILTNLMRQSTTQPVSPPPTATQSQLKQLQSQGAKHTASPETAASSIGECGVKIPFPWTPEGTKVGEGGLEGGVTTEARVTTVAKHSESMNVKEDRKEKAGPPSKRARLQLPESTADVDPLSQGGANMEDVQQWLRALQTWDDISTEEKQRLQHYYLCHAVREIPGVLQCSIGSRTEVREKRSFSAQTLLTLLGLLKEFNPNLATLLLCKERTADRELKVQSRGNKGSGMVTSLFQF
ncbi:zinc finger and BTB domain-containing protein 40-like [Salvelinus namaycush]|uniref:Zinc finger and BTB domain-containing protein 40-like n=1 Tax=Salvelinus namaycush TaxID=8040 RepID=A0A8U1F7J7_SALNM|nr:zinc finger and BTB domain-containing protein 40-like [Salvelinus namaycush]